MSRYTQKHTCRSGSSISDVQFTSSYKYTHLKVWVKHFPCVVHVTIQTQIHTPVGLGPAFPMCSSCQDTNRNTHTCRSGSSTSDVQFMSRYTLKHTPVGLGPVFPTSSSCQDTHRNTPVGLGRHFPCAVHVTIQTQTHTPVGLGPAFLMCRSCQDTNGNTHACRSGSSVFEVQFMSRYTHKHTHL